MSHKFRFTKDCIDRLKRFAKGDQPDPIPAAQEEKAALPQEAPGEEAGAPKETGRGQDEGGVRRYALTDVGKVRASNQDALVEGENLIGVADGMGGHNGGETASTGARDALGELLRGKEPSAEALREAIAEVNARLFRQQKQEASLAGMGTTLTVLWLGKEQIFLGHVGDSRAYRLREGVMEQMTRDHSLVAELCRAGVLTQEQAENHPMRNVITRAVGTEEGIEADIIPCERRKGDRWLVCSDGLHGMVSDQDIQKHLAAGDPQSACRKLIDLANKAGGHDNVSVAILHDQEGRA